MNSISVGRHIKVYRNACKLTQKELASSVGVSANYIARIESGDRMPSLSILEKIAKSVSVGVSDLVSDDPLFLELSSLAKKYGLDSITSELKSLAKLQE